MSVDAKSNILVINDNDTDTDKVKINDNDNDNDNVGLVSDTKVNKGTSTIKQETVKKLDYTKTKKLLQGQKMLNSTVKDKTGRSTSCLLCQKRKQKCDQRLPSCTNCLKLKFECIQPPKYGENQNSNKNNDYTKFLEKQVKQLEKLLDLKVNDLKIDKSKKYTINEEKILKYQKISPLIESDLSLTPVSNSNSNSDNDNDKEHINDLNNSDSIINQSYSTFIDINSTSFNNSILKNYNLNDFIKFDPIIKIDQKFSKDLITIYFKMLQYRFPLLNESDILEFNVIFYDENRKSKLDLNDYYFKSSRMFLIYAISALLYKCTGKYKGPNPFNFFSTAARYLILLSNNLNDFDKIELLILICFFLIRTDKNTNNLYLIVSDAMQCCINLSLHKSKSFINIDSNLKDLKMRKFWCCYTLERSISISISKPFILDESKIDNDLPLFNYEPSKAFNPNNGKTFFINQSIKIVRLKSKFVEDLSILNSKKSISKSQLVKVENYFQDLQNWRNECQGFNNNGIENQTLLFYYYKAVRSLIQPYLELLDPYDDLFKECQAAAGQICQSIKSFHTKTFFGYSILNIHLVFIAGITLIYCLWLQRNRDDMRRKLLGDDKKHTRPTVSEDLFRGLDDLRACSISLYVMCERTKFALSFRDIFEEIMNATIGNLILRCGPDSSEILYRGVSLPPAIFRKPLKHFQIDSNYIEKSDADKLEDEERLKRKGHLTRSAIPKGLSHLLLHPPEFENVDDFNNENYEEKQKQKVKDKVKDKDKDKDKEKEDKNKTKNKNNKNDGTLIGNSFSTLTQERDEDKINAKIKEKSDFGLEKEKSEENDVNRYLPLPIKLSLLPQQTRLPSALKSKSFENDLKSISNNSLFKNDMPLKRRHSKTDSESESIVSKFSNQSNTLSPIMSNLKSNVNLSGLISKPIMNSDISNTNNELSSLNAMPDNYKTSITPQINQNNSNSNIASTSIPDSNNVFNENLMIQNSIPDLFPLVGGTTAMISNISMWTEESGQQIPQTGLTMIHNPDDGNFHANFNDVHFENNNSNVSQNGSVNMNMYQNFTQQFDGPYMNGNINSNTPSNVTNNQHNYNGYNPMDGNKGYTMQHQYLNGKTETLNSWFDVVGNDDFWNSHTDYIGFHP